MYETSSMQEVGPVRHDSPGGSRRRLPQTHCRSWGSHPRVGVTVLVDASIEILQEREVGREQVLDHTGMHVIDITDVADHATISTTAR